MVSLITATDHAFAVGGPAERVLGQHRSTQVEFARDLAVYIETGRASLFVKEAFPGVGKTIAVLIVLALDRVLNGRRSVISTFKRNLRGDYEAAATTAGTIVATTLRELRLPAAKHPLSVGEFKSATSYISPTKMEYLAEQIADGVAAPGTGTFFSHYQDFIAAGIEPEFSQLYDMCPLPPNTTELHWSFCAQDGDTALAHKIRADQDIARSADILLTTHAMLMLDSRSQSKLFADDGGERGAVLVVDEAEKLPSVAYDAMICEISYNDIVSVVADAMTAYPDELAAAEKTVMAGLGALAGWLDTIERTIVLDINDASVEAIMAGLEITQRGLGEMVIEMRSRPGHDPLIHDALSRAYFDVTAVLRARDYTRTKCVIRAAPDHSSGTRDVHFVINYSAGRSLITQLWRQPSGFARLAMLSATLSNRPPHEDSYSRFLTSIGVDPAIDTVIGSKPLVRRNFGRIDEVVVADRSAPPATDVEQPDMINTAFVKYAATALTTLAKRQQDMAAGTRALVLFPSYRLMMRVWEMLPKLHARIIRPQRGVAFQTVLGKFAAHEHGIWFGVEWEGVNFVDPDNQRTLVDMLAIVRLPQPPSDAIRVTRLRDVFGSSADAQHRAEAIELREANDFAYRKMIQGIARGIRNPSDVVKLLMILDARFPVPPHVVETRKIARSANDPNQIFARFDACLDPYRVRHWGQIDESGTITRIL